MIDVVGQLLVGLGRLFVVASFLQELGDLVFWNSIASTPPCVGFWFLRALSVADLRTAYAVR